MTSRCKNTKLTLNAPLIVATHLLRSVGYFVLVTLLTSASARAQPAAPTKVRQAGQPSPQAYAPAEVTRIRGVLLGPPDCAAQLPLAREVLVHHGDLPSGAFANAGNGEGAEAGDAAQVVRRCGNAEDLPRLKGLTQHPNDYARLHVARALTTHGDRKTAREVLRQLAQSPSAYYANRARFEGWLLDEKCTEAPAAVWDDWRSGVAEAAFVPACVEQRLRAEHRSRQQQLQELRP